MLNKQMFDTAQEGYTRILDTFRLMGYTSPIDEANFDGTAERAAKAFNEMFLPLQEIKDELHKILQKTFPASRCRGMIVSIGNMIMSSCPHHLLPVMYRISVAYIPKPENEGGKVIGISKLTRIARILAARPILQESFIADIADTLYADKTIKGFEFPQLETLGSACYCEALHLCMACRGVRQYDARVASSEVRGVFKSQQSTRDEFMDIVTRRSGGLL